MRILVHPHDMEVGGSQLNAIELAEAVRDRGHEVAVYGPDGDLVAEVHRRGLEMIEAPPRRTTPSPSSAARLAGLVAKRKFDLVHAYEWNTLLDTMYGPGWTLGAPVVSTILSMDVPFFLPRSVPMIVGTRDLLKQERSWRSEVHLMEPPIDLHLNRAGVSPTVAEWGGVPVRQHVGLQPDERLVVIVSRLANRLKLDGLLESVDAMTILNQTIPARLVIVGDGPERAQVEARARAVNDAAGRPLVNLVGQLMDPRGAYDGADVVLGMGGSALRAMAFGKPTVVLGERGFALPVTEQTRPIFEEQGWFGVGAGESAAGALADMIKEILTNPDESRRRGELGRRIVVEGYGLEKAAERLEALYRDVASRPRSVRDRILDCGGTTYTLGKFHAVVFLGNLGWRRDG